MKHGTPYLQFKGLQRGEETEPIILNSTRRLANPWESVGGIKRAGIKIRSGYLPFVVSGAQKRALAFLGTKTWGRNTNMSMKESVTDVFFLCNPHVRKSVKV